MTAPRDRRSYSRLETDFELVTRVKAQHPAAWRMHGEPADTFAERRGMARRIINVACDGTVVQA